MKKILIDTFRKLKHEALNAGLILNNNKTEYIYCTRKTIHPTYIKIQGKNSLNKWIHLDIQEKWWILTAVLRRNLKKE